MRGSHFVVAAIVLALASAVACNPFDDNGESDAVSSTPPAEELSAEEIIELGVTRWNETVTVHFELDVEGSTYLDEDQSIELSSAEGDLERPQSVKATAQVSIGLANFDVSLIFIGDDAYMTDFLTGNWGPAPESSYNPSLLLSTTEGLGPVLEQLQDPAVAGTEQVAGREAVHITGYVTEDMIDQLTAGTITGNQIGVDVWFDTETFEVLRLRLTEPEGDDEPAIWNIDFSEHDEPVEIEEPAV